MWDPDRTGEPEKKIDQQRCTESKQKTYNELKLTNELKVTSKRWSTNKALIYIKRMYREQESVEVFIPKDFVQKMITALFGDVDSD